MECILIFLIGFFFLDSIQVGIENNNDNLMRATIGICVNASILRSCWNSFSYANAPLTGKKKEKTNGTLKSHIISDWKKETIDTNGMQNICRAILIHVNVTHVQRYEQRFLFETSEKIVKGYNMRTQLNFVESTYMCK